MNWIGLLIVFGVFIILLVLKRASLISAAAAQDMLRKGAVIVDVRSPDEFSGRHLPNAINIPLDQISSALPRRFPDRTKAILLHCQSGTRSGIARSQLRKLGYAKAFNLGSYSRAAKITSAA